MRQLKRYIGAVIIGLSVCFGGFAWGYDSLLTKQAKPDAAVSPYVYHAVALQSVDMPEVMAVAVKVLATHDKESKHLKALSGLIVVNSAIKPRYCCRKL